MVAGSSSLMVVVSKPVRYKYEFAPRPENRNGRNVPYNGPRT